MNQRNNAKHNKNNPHHKTNNVNNANPKNGKKKNKGQNGLQHDAQIAVLNKPILSFGCAEEHKEVPASNF